LMDMETITDQDPNKHNLPNPSSIDQNATGQDVSDQGMDEYLTNGYDYQALHRGDLRTGVIEEISESGLVVDIGFKREGFVYADDLERLDEKTRSEIQPGATIPVLVIRPENREGQPILSVYQAHLQEDWLKAEQMMKDGELYEAEVSDYNRGGLIAQFGKIRGFIPASQIVGLPRRMREEQRRQRLADMIGQRIGLKIIEVDRQRRRLIFSQRQALRAWQELERDRVMDQLSEGETRHGRVTSITNFGAFVDLGGADGLIHVSELSWGRVDNPRQMLKVGDEVDVYVLNVDRQRKRIALSLKKLQPDPWTMVDDHYRVGQLVEGRVTRVLDFGAFVELDLGVEGLLHSSEMIGTPELSPSDIIHARETLLVKIIRIDSRRKRLALSAKQVRRDEWERWVAEQQAAREAEREAAALEAREAAAREAEREAAALEAEAAAGEVVEEEVAAPEAEAAAGEVVEEEVAAPEAEAAAGEVVEAEVAAPEAEAAAGEVAEEKAATSETIAGEASVGETTMPEIREADAEEATADEVS